jgi:adenylate cyclase
MPKPSPSSIDSRRRKGITTLWVVISFLVAHAVVMLMPQVFEPWDAQIIDRLFVLRNNSPRWRPAYDNTVVHVDINNSSVRQLKSFYLNRSHYARLIRNLAAMGASAQAYDFIFAAPVNDRDDGALIEATKDAGNVYYGMALALGTGQGQGPRDQVPGGEVSRYLRKTGWKVAPEGTEEDNSSLYVGSQPLLTFLDLASVARGLGFLSVRSDRDGVYRRAPLLVRCDDGSFQPSFPFRVVCDYLGVAAENISVSAGGGTVTLKGARCPGKPPHDIVIPIDGSGSMIVNFIGPWERMVHYNFADIYRASENPEKMEMWKEEMDGRLVLISDVSTGSTDIGPVPTDVNMPLSALHTNVIHTILTESFVRDLSARESAAVELLLLAVVLVLCLRFSSLGLSLGALAAALGYAMVVAVAFLHGRVILHVIRPELFMGFSALMVTAYRYICEEKEKAVLRKSFEAYFPPQVVRKIIANPEMVRSKGEKKELTVLFSDIKDFTALSAGLSPDRIRKYLNEYFEAMVDIVFGHQGTVDKYIGDGLMVFFGDPEPQADHALRCVRAAVDMQRRVSRLRDEWEKDGGIPIRIRIGINTGEMVVGNMGSARRLSYTVLGASVNLAQRLETNAPVGGIMISERTHELVEGLVPTRPLGQLQVKGFDVPVNVYEVLVEPEPPA